KSKTARALQLGVSACLRARLSIFSQLLRLCVPIRNFSLLAACLSCLLFASPSPQALSQASIQQILNNGPAGKRVNIAFLSEGYTASQLPQFLTDARNGLDYLMTVEPYNEYKNYFNAFAISVASNESGSDHPSRGIFRDTYFNSSYESYGLARGLTIPPNDWDPNPADGFGKAHALLENLLPEWDVIVLIVNDPEFGGWGDKRGAISSVQDLFPEIIAHELGHAFGGLNDEYSDPFPGDPDPVVEEPNTTQENRREFIKWRAWISDRTPIPTPQTSEYGNVVGLFEGARFQSTGWYRPKLTCKMRAFFQPFCEVCREALVKSIYTRVRPVESFSPSGTTISVVGSQFVSFSFVPMLPSTHKLDIQWFVNGSSIGGATLPAFSVSTAALGNGTQSIKVEASDLTPMVRTDPTNLLRDSVAWNLMVSGIQAPPPRPRRRP
ncbi:MAG TPA: M64 family metallopeptidase, partial [Acidobacteriota bacterium]